MVGVLHSFTRKPLEGTLSTENFDSEIVGLAAAQEEALAFRKQEQGGDSANVAADHNLLDEFMQSAAEEITNIVTLPVTSRPGDWALEFDAVITDSELKRWRKNSVKSKGRRGSDGEANVVVTYAQLLAEKNLGVYKGLGKDRKQVFDTDGSPLLLRSEEFLKVMQQSSVRDAVRDFLTDAGTLSMGAAVLNAAGWTEDLTPLDPTER